MVVDDPQFTINRDPGVVHSAYNGENIFILANYPDLVSPVTPGQSLSTLTMPDAYRLFAQASYLSFKLWSYGPGAADR